MMRLIRIEWYKLRPKTIFWVVTFGFFALLSTMIWGMQTVLNQTINEATVQTGVDDILKLPSLSLYEFPGVWHNLVFFGDLLVVRYMLVFIGMILITDEFNFRTHRLSIMNGMSRASFFSSKLIMMLILSLVTGLLVFILGLTLGLIHSPNISEMFTEIYYIPLFIFQSFAFLSFGLMLAFIFRRFFLSFIIFIFYTILELYLVTKVGESIAPFLPMNSIESLIQMPNSGLMEFFNFEFKEGVTLIELSVAAIYTGIFIFISWLIFKKKDL